MVVQVWSHIIQQIQALLIEVVVEEEQDQLLVQDPLMVEDMVDQVSLLLRIPHNILNSFCNENHW